MAVAHLRASILRRHAVITPNDQNNQCSHRPKVEQFQRLDGREEQTRPDSVAERRRIEEIGVQLRRISEIGIASEANGDYFTSGDLAYQLHEIVRTTRELLKRSLRSERP